MTYKNTKTVLFTFLIAAMIITLAGIEFTTEQDRQISKQKLQIDIPQDLPEKVAVHEKAMALFTEKDSINAELATLKAKYDAVGPDGLTSNNIKNLDRIKQELIDVNLKIDQINADARALITMTPEEKDRLYEDLVTIRESNIPFTGVWTEENGKAVGVSFETQQLADKYAEIIETMIKVPFYVEVRSDVILDTCTSLTADCEPPTSPNTQIHNVEKHDIDVLQARH